MTFNITIPFWIRVMALMYREEKSYVRQISKKLDLTYSHAHKIIADLQKRRLLSLNKEGRKNIITITKNGSVMGKYCDFIEAFTEARYD